MFARFDENPAVTLQDIKETKRYGRTDAHTDGQHENSIPTTNKVCGGYNNNNSLYFQRVTHLAKKKLIFHEALYELPPKNNTSIKYKDDFHTYCNLLNLER